MAASFGDGYQRTPPPSKTDRKCQARPAFGQESDQCLCDLPPARPSLPGAGKPHSTPRDIQHSLGCGSYHPFSHQYQLPAYRLRWMSSRRRKGFRVSSGGAQSISSRDDEYLSSHSEQHGVTAASPRTKHGFSFRNRMARAKRRCPKYRQVMCVAKSFLQRSLRLQHSAQ